MDYDWTTLIFKRLFQSTIPITGLHKQLNSIFNKHASLHYIILSFLQVAYLIAWQKTIRHIWRNVNFDSSIKSICQIFTQHLHMIFIIAVWFTKKVLICMSLDQNILTQRIVDLGVSSPPIWAHTFLPAKSYKSQSGDPISIPVSPCSNLSTHWPHTSSSSCQPPPPLTDWARSKYPQITPRPALTTATKTIGPPNGGKFEGRRHV